MTIEKYEDSGVTFFKVYANFRSEKNPKHRAQKRKKGITSYYKAQIVEKQLLQECMLDVEKQDGKRLSWGELIDKWVEFKKTDKYHPLLPYVLSDYHIALKTWTTSIWNMEAEAVSRGNVRDIIAHMEAAGISKAFQSKVRGILNRVFVWGIDEKVINMPLSPAHGILVNRKAERVPTILNRQEVVKLLELAKFYEHDWYPIWAMAVMTGCRNGELYAMTWDDVDFCNMTVRISKSFNKRMNHTKCTKAGYRRTVPINSELKQIILELKNKSKDEFLLPRPRAWRNGYQATILKDFCKQIGITPIRFHDLRAVFATQLLQTNVSPATIMKICGWKDLDTMGRYIRLAGVDESGATDRLQFLTSREAVDKVTSIFSKSEVQQS